MQLSKNGGQTHIPLCEETNIKGTVSGTLCRRHRIARSAFYASPTPYVNALSHLGTRWENQAFKKGFCKPPHRIAAKHGAPRNEQTRHAFCA
jgi:hypothetical protein